MKNMMTIQDRVEVALLKHPEARDDDDLLYFYVCQDFNPLITHMTFGDVLRQREIFNVPNYESVGRARRKLQEKRADLQGSAKATDARFERWKEMRAYAET